MTNSSVNNSLENEEETLDFSNITNFDKVKYEPANVFNNGTQKNSYFDWNTTVSYTHLTLPTKRIV